MAPRFRKIPKLLLRNSAHFQFHTRFRERYGALTYAEPQMDALYARYCAAYERVDEGLNRIRRSVLTEDIREADRARDRVYSGMVLANAAALRHFDALPREAAQRLQIVFDGYGNITRESFDAQTAAAYNIVQELRGEGRRADVEAVGLSAWVDELAARNAAVDELVARRDDESSRRTSVAVKPARAELDRAYDELAEVIEALALVGAPEAKAALGAFIAEFNVAIDRYSRLLSATRRRPRAAESAAGGEDESHE